MKEKQIEKCRIAINKGYTYDASTGLIMGLRGNNIKSKHSRGYINFQVKNEGKVHSILGHQFAWFYLYNEIAEEIDHINGDKTDNRLENLRSVTHQQNMWNVKNALGYSFHKKIQKYMAYIVVDRKMKHLGYFNDKNLAREAYLNAKKQLHKI